MKVSNKFTGLFKLFLPLLIGVNIFGRALMLYFNIDTSEVDFAFQIDLLSYSFIVIGLFFYLPSLGRLKEIILLTKEKKLYIDGKYEISFKEVLSMKKYHFIYGKIIYQEKENKKKTALFLLKFSDIFRELAYMKTN